MKNDWSQNDSTNVLNCTVIFSLTAVDCVFSLTYMTECCKHQPSSNAHSDSTAEATLTMSLAESPISCHSGASKEYLPSMMSRSMNSCLRCQKGGKPASLRKSKQDVQRDISKTSVTWRSWDKIPLLSTEQSLQLKLVHYCQRNYC